MAIHPINDTPVRYLRIKGPGMNRGVDLIILDTNAVHDLDPHGSRADLIRMLRAVGLRVGVPWVVLEELTAHKLYEYQREFELMLRHHRRLLALEPSLIGAEPEFRGREFASHWREQYRGVFDIIPTGVEALQAAVLREAACMKPAKVDKSKKSGGRDVAVWFSVLNYLDENPSEEVHFVTNNTADFGDPGEWPFPLDVDLLGKSHRIRQIAEFEEILREFTEEAAFQPGLEDSLNQKLSLLETRELIAREAWVRLTEGYGKKRKGDLPSDVLLKVSFDSMGSPECRKIGESVWSWAQVKWQVYMLRMGASEPFIVTWDTSVLFPDKEEYPVSLLRSGSFSPLSYSDLNEELRYDIDEEMSISQSDALILDDYRQMLGDQSNMGNNLPSRFDVAESARQHLSSREHSTWRSSGHIYSRQVFQRLRSMERYVEYTDGPGDMGRDAVIATAEGAIAVSITSRSGKLGISGLVQASHIPYHMGDAILIVTGGPISGNIDRHVSDILENESRPIEIAQWSGPSDDVILAEKIQILKSRLASRNGG